MPRKRKTIEVSQIRDWINHSLENSPSGAYEKRQALAGFLTTVLMETGNYAGFNYLAWMNGGCDQWRADGEPKDNTKYLGDQTRVFFYAK